MERDLHIQLKQLQQLHHGKPYPSLEDRISILKLLKKALQDNAYTISDAVSTDYIHRSQQETLFLEIFSTINAINYVLANLKKWMKQRKRHVSWQLKPARAYVMPQPLGVVGIIVPWNYPIFLSLIPAVYALAAGNRLMIKMSELSPHTGTLLQTLIGRLGLGEHVVVVNGDVEVSKQFAALPFNHLLFTGSTFVGKQVMRAASEHLTPVTLELGGKSPAILSRTMDKVYFKRLFMGKMFNAGQTCTAPDYLFVPEGWSDSVEHEFRSFLSQHYPDLMQDDDYTNIISEKQKQRLLDLVQDAKDKGARVVEFGEMSKSSTRLPVYVLFDVTEDMGVMKEEIFGPILPVLNYKSFDEVVTRINAASNPLALYYFGTDAQEINQLQTQTLSGAFVINDAVVHAAIDDLPFGGVGASGMGHYRGQEGFDTFSQLKPVMTQRRFSSIVLMYPPYGKLLDLYLRWVGGIKPKKN